MGTAFVSSMESGQNQCAIAARDRLGRKLAPDAKSRRTYVYRLSETIPTANLDRAANVGDATENDGHVSESTRIRRQSCRASHR